MRFEKAVAKYNEEPDSELIEASRENPAVNHANETFLERMYKERALQEVLRRDEEYRKADEVTRQKIKEIDQIEMDKKECEIIDRALPATNARNADYGRAAYKQRVSFRISIWLNPKIER